MFFTCSNRGCYTTAIKSKSVKPGAERGWDGCSLLVLYRFTLRCLHSPNSRQVSSYQRRIGQRRYHGKVGDLHRCPTSLKYCYTRYINEHGSRTERLGKATEDNWKRHCNEHRADDVPNFLLAVSIDENPEDGCHESVHELTLGR